MSTTVYQPQFVAMQLSFSTADIEKSVFYSTEYTPIKVNEPTGNIMMLAVNGELFVLEESTPQRSIPLTEESGLFRIIGLDQQA
jgi:hypothetical protein